MAGFGRCGGDPSSLGTVAGPDAGTLLWSDEFDGDAGAPPDSAKWGYDVGTGDQGWGNSQLEYDTDSTNNVSLDGQGHLMIVAREQSFMGSSYTSARINTAGKFQQAYGRFEASIQLPVGQGIWPAFWLLGSTNGTSWPTCGEIDIMEAQGQSPAVNHGSMHGPGYSGGAAKTATYRLPGMTPLNDGFHLYAIDWSEDEVDFSLDGTVYEAVTKADLRGDPWVFDHPFFIILNVAVGGTFVGSPSGSTVFPQTMLVDYVRVYGPPQ